MKGLAGEWRRLTGSGALLLFSLLVDAGMILGGMAYLEDAEETLAKLRASIATLREQQRRNEGQNRELELLQPGYDRLRALGVPGEEPRMRWVEALHDLERELKLPAPVQYKLEPARPFTGAPVQGGGERMRLFVSPMEITFGMIHEGDLFEMIGVLERKQVGLFRFLRCRMALAGREAGEKAFRSGVNLTGECGLEWFTIREEEGKGK
ncbi:MAG: hypothetical protein HQL96_16515 [Magnetococcales bacterium]|nr:hypothetical protein [Magnetococcales bacterium]